MISIVGPNSIGSSSDFFLIWKVKILVFYKKRKKSLILNKLYFMENLANFSLYCFLGFIFKKHKH